MLPRLSFERRHVLASRPPALAVTTTSTLLRVLEKRGVVRQVDLGSGREASIDVGKANAGDGAAGTLGWVTDAAFVALGPVPSAPAVDCALPGKGTSVALNRGASRAYATTDGTLQVHVIELSFARAAVVSALDIDAEFRELTHVMRGFDESVIVNSFASPDEQEFFLCEPFSRRCSTRIEGEAPILCERGWLVTFAPPSSSLVVRGGDLSERWRMPCELPNGDRLEPRATAILRGDVLAIAAERTGVHLFSLATGEALASPTELAVKGMIAPIDDASFLRWRIETRPPTLELIEATVR